MEVSKHYCMLQALTTLDVKVLKEHRDSQEEAGKQLQEALLTLTKLTGLHLINLDCLTYTLPESDNMGNLKNLRYLLAHHIGNLTMCRGS
jgi:predicted amino acid racemase